MVQHTETVVEPRCIPPGMGRVYKSSVTKVNAIGLRRWEVKNGVCEYYCPTMGRTKKHPKQSQHWKNNGEYLNSFSGETT